MREQIALACLQCVSGNDPLPRKLETFLDATTSFGFEAAVAGAWVGIGGSRAYRFYFNTWPQAWLELYEREGIFTDDPFAAETRRTMKPFRWTELRRRHGFQTGRCGEIDAMVVAFGWKEVIGIPVHGPSGYQGLVSLGTLQPCGIDAGDLQLLRGISLAIHDACHDVVGFGRLTRQIPEPTLTDREVECMRWVGAGKTDGEIGVILGISPSTVHFHIERVKKKLDVRSRAEAVGLLVLEGVV